MSGTHLSQAPADSGDPSPELTLVNFRLPEFAHSAAYDELADGVRFALRRRGWAVRLAFAAEGIRPRSLLFGAHLLRHFAGAEQFLLNDTILFNTEHVTSPHMDADYLALLSHHDVWDYSADNAAALTARLGRPVRHILAGYVPEFSRVSPADEDIDVLFYGSMNPRRQAVLDQLAASGLRVHAAFGVYGRARDALIARAKTVLNIHFYQPGHFEVLRVGYLMANRKAVITEANPGETVDADLLPGLAAVPYDALVETVSALVQDAPRRAALAQSSFDAFAARDMGPALAAALGARWGGSVDGTPVTPPPRLPGRITIGSGKTWDAEVLNVDIDRRWNPDIVADITDKDLFLRDFISPRFGAFRLPRETFEAITASHVLEHLPDLVTAMTNCLNLLADGGLMHIAVPYDLSYGAWQDPTHVRGFNERSWWYYCDWYWYLGWTEARFDLISQNFLYSAVGTVLSARGIPEEEILRTPRAVDEMRVVLRRRPLTAEERAHGQAMRGDARA